MKLYAIFTVVLLLSACDIRDNGSPSSDKIRTLCVNDLTTTLAEIDKKVRPDLKKGFYCSIIQCDDANGKYVLTIEYEINGIPGKQYVVISGSGNRFTGVLSVAGIDDHGNPYPLNIPILADYERYQILFK
jgi:hypothetical protein